MVAGALKKFLRELVPPLFTFERYEVFLEAWRRPGWDERLQAVAKQLEALPKGYGEVAVMLLTLLNQIQEVKGTNMMDAQNLAIVFAPTILRQDTTDPVKLMMDMEANTALVSKVALLCRV